MKIRLIEKYLDSFYKTFESRPGMIGSPENVYSMFLYMDAIEHIVKYGEVMPNEYSWMTFLIDRGYIEGAKENLLEALRLGRGDFSMLQSARIEYKVWFQAKVNQQSKGASISKRSVGKAQRAREPGK